MNFSTWYRRCLWLGAGLGLIVVVLGAYVRLSDAGLGCPDWPGCYGHLVLPAVLLGVVVFQGLLGMWTVTLLLKPLIVMGHLLGGLATLGLLSWLLLETGRSEIAGAPSARRVSLLAVSGLAILIAQIALGGRTSSNYAALACPDIPTCQG